MRFLSVIVLLGGIVLLPSCRTTSKVDKIKLPEVSSLKFLDSASIPFNMTYRGTVAGGLSGIDFVPSRNIYYMICDDPSVLSPARFYTAQVSISNYGIDSVSLVAVDSVWNDKGQLYPDIRKDRIHSADMEAMRYNPVRDELVRSSEGQRYIKDSTRDFQQPEIVMMERNGHYKDSLPLPGNVRVFEQEKGLRHNMVFEGLTFLRNYREMIVSVEDALYEDGSSAATGDSTAWVRFLHFDISKKKQLAQYAYQVDAVPHPATPAGAFKVNGVSDILAMGNHHLLVLERAWSTGRGPSDIRVYLADLRRASNIAGNSSLKAAPARRPVHKKLLLDMASLGFSTYNIEGLTFGPDLPNGHRTLVFVADNNFRDIEKSQFLLFEVIP